MPLTYSLFVWDCRRHALRGFDLHVKAFYLSWSNWLSAPPSLQNSESQLSVEKIYIICLASIIKPLSLSMFIVNCVDIRFQLSSDRIGTQRGPMSYYKLDWLHLHNIQPDGNTGTWLRKFVSIEFIFLFSMQIAIIYRYLYIAAQPCFGEEGFGVNSR